MNDNLIELLERVTPWPDEVKEKVRVLPQVPDEWLNGIRKIINKAGSKHASELSTIRKVKLAFEVKKLAKKIKTLDGWLKDSELI